MIHMPRVLFRVANGLISGGCYRKCNCHTHLLQDCALSRRIGYVRVSTSDQKLTVQKSALERDGCAVNFEEKRTGTKRNEREPTPSARTIGSLS